MTRAQPIASSPMSRRFDAALARDGGTPFRIESTAAERDALAADCGIPGIDALTAAFQVARDGAHGLRVTGTVSAGVRQVCVVTLEEFASAIEEAVDVRFAPEDEVDALAAARAARPPGTGEDEADDPPDPIVNGRIDLGALAVEIVVLALDPYPRKPGAAFSEPVPREDEPAASPFAVLRAVKGAGQP